MNKPKPIPEDPALKAAQLREQARAEAQQTSESQALLSGDTLTRLRRFGQLPAGAGPQGAAGSPGMGGYSNPGGMWGHMFPQLWK